MPGSMCHSMSCTESLVYLQNYKYEEEAQTCMSATMHGPSYEAASAGY